MKLLAAVLALTATASPAQNLGHAERHPPTEVPLSARLALASLADNHLTEDEGMALAQTPGIAPHLVPIITAILDKPGDFEHLHKVFQVLRNTRNIPEDQMTVIRARLTACLNTPVDSGIKRVLRSSGLYLMAEHPSPANEALLIRFLDESPPASGTDYSFIAADALGICGGPAAQAALENYQRIHPVRTDVVDKCADYAAKSLERIRTRLGAANATQTPTKENSAQKPDATTKP